MAALGAWVPGATTVLTLSSNGWTRTRLTELSIPLNLKLMPTAQQARRSKPNHIAELVPRTRECSRKKSEWNGNHDHMSSNALSPGVVLHLCSFVSVRLFFLAQIISR